MEMRRYHKILPISQKDQVTYEEICAKIQQVIGLCEVLSNIVTR